MAEYTRDADDQRLDALFATDAIADAGFSEQVMRKVQRQLWIRRLTLPIAAVIGGSIAIKPLSSIVAALDGLSGFFPAELFRTTTDALPQTPLMLEGVLLFVVVMLGVRALEE